MIAKLAGRLAPPASNARDKSDANKTSRPNPNTHSLGRNDPSLAQNVTANSNASPTAMISSQLGRTATDSPWGSATITMYAADAAPTFLTLFVMVCTPPDGDMNPSPPRPVLVDNATSKRQRDGRRGGRGDRRRTTPQHHPPSNCWPNDKLLWPISM
ncbi:Os12g0635901 [Oryza sativa Japonica Group]|uniref:Os12g0635901 protein n=1 Tax=Oryza sativa subsp. japonica TaxID=39947 RepID=A0A0P0YDJ0_ORYSJ|nr:Os12g0635901 [Oryza sativa Japonica Group]